MTGNPYFYYIAMALAGAVGLVKGVVYAIILSPAEFGALNLINIVASFLVYLLSCGIVEAVALRLPLLYGEGRAATAAAIARRATIAFLWTGLIVSALLSLILTVVRPEALNWVLAPLVATSAGVLSILLSDSRSSGNLEGFGAISFLKILVAFALGVPGGIAYGIMGVVAGELLGQTLLGFWIFFGLKRVKALEAADPLPSSSHLRKEGRSMLTHNIFQVAQQNIDRLFVVYGLGATALGQYGFAALLITAASLLHGVLFQQVGPAALRNLAEGVPLNESFLSTRRIAVKAAFLMAFAGILAWVVWHVFRPSAFAPYEAALEILPLIAAAAVFQVAQLFDWIVAGGKRTHTLAKISVLIALLHALFGLVGIWLSMPLWFFATLTLVNRASTAVAGFVLARLVVTSKLPILGAGTAVP